MKRLFFDFETDGLVGPAVIRQDRWPRIIEIYAALYDDEIFQEELDTLVNPGRKVDQEITKITGINNEMLEGEPYFPEVAPKFLALVSKADEVVAHNLTFDKTVFELDSTRMSLPAPVWPMVICTVEASEHYFMRRLKLMELHQHLFKEGFASAHRAKGDVIAMVRCFFEMNKRGDI